MKKHLSWLVSAAFILSVLSANQVFASWTAPTANPPGNNTESPIDAGAGSQIKAGALVVNNGGTADSIGLWVPAGILKTNALRITGGTPALGQVLTSDAFGNATWQTPATGAVGWTDDSANGYLYATTASRLVGLGTATPSAKLQIVNNDASRPALLIQQITAAGGALNILSASPSGDTTVGANIMAGAFLAKPSGPALLENNAQTNGVGVTNAGDIYIGGAGAPFGGIYVSPSGGHVGIGTDSPGALYKLNVSGDTNISGNTTISGTLNVSGAITVANCNGCGGAGGPTYSAGNGIAISGSTISINPANLASCTASQKLTYNGTAFSCATDQTGAAAGGPTYSAGNGIAISGSTISINPSTPGNCNGFSQKVIYNSSTGAFGCGVDSLGDHTATRSLNMNGNTITDAYSVSAIGPLNAVRGISNGTGYAGISGTDNVGYGVYGSGQTGVYGYSSFTNGYGVYAESAGATNPVGVYGIANNSNTGVGVAGYSNSGTGVYARSVSGTALDVVGRGLFENNIDISGALTLRNGDSVSKVDFGDKALPGGGNCTAQECTYSVGFNHAFPTGSAPIVIVEPYSPAGFTDVFATTVYGITTTGFNLAVYRVDGTQWGQALHIHYWAAIH